ncbi:MAG TPA: YfdX family protein [Nautiliaceae bacterium]|nr:YfdX family protein [Nautiliaceae bacterium]
MKKLLLSVALAGILTTSLVAADAKTNLVSNNAVTKAEQKAQNTELIKEAVRAIKYTQDALLYLAHNKIDQAKETLKKAVGELTVVLNSPNPPYLLPVDVQIEAYEFNGDLKKIEVLKKEAKTLLLSNKIPEARNILNTLRSEIVIKTINLPLATYPAALNLAIKYLNENKVKEAMEVLAMALSTLVEVDNIIPIPLIKAQALIEEASKTKNPKQALKYLQEAKNQLIIAEALGYTSKSSTTYKMLKEKIEKIEKEIKKGKNVTSLFKELIQKIKDFKEKAINIIHQ